MLGRLFNWHLLKDRYVCIFVVIYLLVAYLTIFNHLSSNPIREFDEARMGISAYEMLQTKNPVVVNFLGEPVLWNTKPPLVICIEALSTRIFGLGEFAIRFPSALALFFTGIILILFGVKLRKTFFGFLSSLLLLCSWDLVFWHCGRTADYDAFLLLFNTTYILCFWLYIQNNGQKKYLLLFFIFLTLAALTKDIAGFVSLPVLIVYAFVKKQVLPILKEKYFWAGFLIFIVFFGGFLVTREIMAPGYLKAMWQNDVFGRYTQALEHSSSSPLFYFSRFYKHTFKYLFIFIPFAFLLNIFNKEKQARDLNYFAFGVFAFIFLVLAFSKTKLYWYAYPAVPMLCIILALTIDFFRSIFDLQTNKAQKICCYIFMFVVFFAVPLSDNIFSYKGSFSISAKKEGSPYPYPNYIRLLKIHKQDIIDKKIDNLYFLQKEWPLDSYYYYLTFRDKGANVHYLGNTDWNNLPENIHAVTVDNKESTEVLDKYEWEEVCSFGKDDEKARIIKIKKKK